MDYRLNPRDYLLGYFAGDGSHQSNGAVLFFGTREDELRVREAAKLCGVDLEFRYADYHQSGNEVFRATWPRSLLPNLGSIDWKRGEGLPRVGDSATYLAGYWDADGCVSFAERQTPGRVGTYAKALTLRGKDLRLIEHAKALLFDLGIESHISTGVCNTLRVRSASYRRFKEKITLQRKKQAILDRIVNGL